jgi:hypothetical protein
LGVVVVGGGVSRGRRGKAGEQGVGKMTGSADWGCVARRGRVLGPWCQS